jgi:RNA polymerase sigma-70 factor (ECF subfamily)
MLAQAHQASGDGPDATAQRVLMERYHRAVYRYLLGAVRDPDAAEELFQEFAMRFLRGDFRRATPRRGRFRDYVKAALSNLVNGYHRQRRASPRSLPSDLAGPNTPPVLEAGTSFERSWSLQLIEQAWAELERGHPLLCAVLRFHVQNPDARSPRIAAEVSPLIGRTLTANHARVTLHRARRKFAELLAEEVRGSLDSPTHAELLKELRELRLLKLCEPALAPRQAHAPLRGN